LKKFDDKAVKRICGSDAALYLYCLRISAEFFTIISMLNIGLIFMYVTGNPKPKPESFYKDSMNAL